MFYKKFSVCLLFYGDHLDLARRCLNSIRTTMSEGHNWVRDFRLALNDTVSETASFGKSWAQAMWSEFQVPTLIYETDRNAFKYPLMRRMIYDKRPPAELVMWFDDDSYLEGHANWWAKTSQAIEEHDMIGQPWYLPISNRQWEWVKTQPWCNPDLGPPPEFRGRPAIRFCQGAWWVMRSAVLRRYNWPIPELRHNGGDSLLGELCRHRGLRMGTYYKGVRINADQKGTHSGMKRRGFSEPVIGAKWKPGDVIDISHQQFRARRSEVGTWEVPSARGRGIKSEDQLFREAQACRKQGDLNKAHQLLRSIVGSRPDHAEAWQLLGSIAIAVAQPREAVRCLTAASKLAPNNPAVLCNLGLAHRHVGELERATDCFRAAVRLKPDHTVARKNLGVALLEQKQWSAARECFEYVLQLDEGDHDARRLLGRTLAKQGHATEAVRQLERALALNPEAVNTRYELGLALQQANRDFDAVACFEQVHAARPRHLGALKNLGDVLRKQGNHDAAVRHFEKLVEIAPDVARYRCRLAAALMEQGRLEPAAAQWDTAMILDPTSLQAQLGSSVLSLRRGAIDAARERLERLLYQRPAEDDGD